MQNLISQYGGDLLQGFGNTLLSSFIALVLSLILGSIVGIFQTTPYKGLKLVGDVYVEFFRNIPLLIIVMFFYVVMPLVGFKMSGLTAGVIGLTLYTSAYIADVVRTGIHTVPKGQLEAGYSQGFSFWETMRYIIFPQAFKIILPPLGNQFINLVKNSSVLAMVAGMDLMYYGDVIASTTFDTVNSYILVALFYLVITLPLTYAVRSLERKWNLAG